MSDPALSTTFLSRGSINYERDYARWLVRIESRAILPMKVGMLILTMLFWIWMRDWQPPSMGAFSIFVIYGIFTVAQAGLFWLDRVSTFQVRPLVYISYLTDLFFITALIWIDRREPPPVYISPAIGSDFHILYLLLILRGFALFRTTVENLVVAMLISLLFLVSLFWNHRDVTESLRTAMVIRLGLVWGIMLLASFIINIVSKQQEEVLRVRERLVRAEGLASLGELAAGVAHEINNPIGIIKTYAEYLKKAVPPDNPQYEDFDTIQSEAERCETIVRRMLDFANPNIRSMEIVDVTTILNEVIDFVFHKKKDADIAVTFDVEGKLPSVLADTVQIKQAFLNILVNARQILLKQDKPGKMEIKVRQMPGPRAPIQIIFHDNGPGIKPEDAEHAFEPFFTRRAGGTGLGLAITRRIIDAHDGTIEIWPAANGGTSCVITLPIVEHGSFEWHAKSGEWNVPG